MLCLWVNGKLNTAIRERSRILELQDTLKDGCRSCDEKDQQLQTDYRIRLILHLI